MSYRDTKKFFKLIVSGRGIFPTDMLRYDQCFPCSELDSSLMEETGEQRQVELCAVSHPNWKPTTGRWNSFNWQVVSWEEV